MVYKSFGCTCLALPGTNCYGADKESLSGRQFESSESLEQISNLLYTYTDLDVIARRVIGSKIWRKQSAGDTEDFKRFFSELLELSYYTKIKDYRNADFEITRSRVQGSKAAVYVTYGSGTQTAQLVYRMLALSDAGRKIYEIPIEGVSLVRNFRKQFLSVIKHHGFSQMLVDLRKHAEKVRSEVLFVGENT